MHPTEYIAIKAAHDANVAKLTQLIADAGEKAESYKPFTSKADENTFHYYQGMRDGLRRALNVIEGKG